MNQRPIGPDTGLTLSLTNVGQSIPELFRAEAAAGDFMRVILARKALFQTLFFSIRNAAEEASALIDHRLERFPNDPSDLFKMSDDERRLGDEIATHMALYADASNALIMLLDAPLRRLGEACGQDQRMLGDDAYNNVKFSEAIWALSNRHRHLHSWNIADKVSLEKEASVRVLRRLNVDPLGFDTAYQVLKKANFKSYHDFERRVLSIPNSLLTSLDVDVEATANGWNMTIRAADPDDEIEGD